VNVELVTVGTELLLGLTVDTNGAEIGRACAADGLRLVRRATVGDDVDAIRDAVSAAMARAPVVITTGGLGPTRDDATKLAIAGLFGRRVIEDPEVLRALEERARRMGRWPMAASNRSQAAVPDGAVVLPNPRGTAPGLWLEHDARIVIMLPGVPREMRGLLHEEVLPRLRQRMGDAVSVVRSRAVRVTGIAESTLADLVGPREDELAPLTLAYLPSEAGVDLRLTAWALPPDAADRALAAGVGRLMALVGAPAYGEDETDLAAVVLTLLRQRGATLAVAESCTGGMLGARITAVPGSSDVFVGGEITYANEVKSTRLGVPADLLAAHGAVSEPVARAMADGARRVFGSDAGIAVTGVAGPAGGTPQKPVGTVWLAADWRGAVRVAQVRFSGDRGEIRSRAAQGALNLLRLLVIGG